MHSNWAHRLKIYHNRWHLLATFGIIIVPFLFLVAFARIAHVETDSLIFDFLISCWRLLIAYILAATVAWICAVTFFKGKRATVVLPLFDVLQSFPTYAALPLVVLKWGPSNWVVITFLALEIIWPIFFSIVSSLKLTRRDWQEAVTMSQLSGSKYLKKFIWPMSEPGLITGSVIGLGDGWQALVATEIIVGIQSGLGHFFQNFSHNLNITSLGILGLLIIIFSINKLIWLPLLEWSHQSLED